jgi:hypothetical protein
LLFIFIIIAQYILRYLQETKSNLFIGSYASFSAELASAQQGGQWKPDTAVVAGTRIKATFTFQTAFVKQGGETMSPAEKNLL